jgi:hypothetical protein
LGDDLKAYFKRLNMNKYIEEFREMLYKFQGNYPKYGKVFYMKMNELEELIVFIKKVCEKAQMYDDLCK